MFYLCFTTKIIDEKVDTAVKGEKKMRHWENTGNKLKCEEKYRSNYV